jgi:hypothetical protein
MVTEDVLLAVIAGPHLPGGAVTMAKKKRTTTDAVEIITRR